MWLWKKKKIEGWLIDRTSHPGSKPSHLWYFIFSPYVTNLLKCFQISRSKINFFQFSLLYLNSDHCYFTPRYWKNFLTFWPRILHPLQSATLLPHQIYLPWWLLWVFCSSQALHQNWPAFSHILASVSAPVTTCQTLHHPSRSISGIIFPMKLPCPLQLEMIFPVSGFLKITIHSSFIFYYLIKDHILYLALINTWTRIVLSVLYKKLPATKFLEWCFLVYMTETAKTMNSIFWPTVTILCTVPDGKIMMSKRRNNHLPETSEKTDSYKGTVHHWNAQ